MLAAEVEAARLYVVDVGPLPAGVENVTAEPTFSGYAVGDEVFDTWLVPPLNVQSSLAPVKVAANGVKIVDLPLAPIVEPVVTVKVPTSHAHPVPLASPPSFAVFANRLLAEDVIAFSVEVFGLNDETSLIPSPFQSPGRILLELKRVAGV